MKKQIEQVAHFNKVAGQKQYPDFSNSDVLSLKLGLIKEELKELEEAVANNDRVETLDATIDLLFVLHGFAWTYNLENSLEEGFERVYNSNMSKFCLSRLEAVESVKAYKDKGIETEIKKEGDYYVILRSSDKKILKSHLYSPVNLKNLV